MSDATWVMPQPSRVTKPPRFPAVTKVKGRGYVLRSKVNSYKAELQAYALGIRPVEPPPEDPDCFVPLKDVAAELGVGRRTIGRRIVESQSGGG
jgi:hypothetical protein